MFRRERDGDLPVLASIVIVDHQRGDVRSDGIAFVEGNIRSTDTIGELWRLFVHGCDVDGNDRSRGESRTQGLSGQTRRAIIAGRDRDEVLRGR